MGKGEAPGVMLGAFLLYFTVILSLPWIFQKILTTV